MSMVSPEFSMVSPEFRYVPGIPGPLQAALARCWRRPVNSSVGQT